MEVSQSFCTDFRQLFFFFFLRRAKLLRKVKADFFEVFLFLGVSLCVACSRQPRGLRHDHTRCQAIDLTWKCRRGANLEWTPQMRLATCGAWWLEPLLRWGAAAAVPRLQDLYWVKVWPGAPGRWLNHEVRRKVWRSPVVSSHSFLSHKLGVSVGAFAFRGLIIIWLAGISSQHEWQHFCLADIDQLAW